MSKGKKTITRKRKPFRPRGGTSIKNLSRIQQRSFRGLKTVERGGDIYDGRFINDILVNGKITRGYSGMIDDGKFVNERLTEGTRTYEDGIIEKGNFDERLIKGTITHPNGIIINVGAVEDDNHGRPY